MAITALSFSSCKKERKKDGFLGSSVGGTPVVKGCTDATATNYNASANQDDGTCMYNGSVTFYYNSSGSYATVYLGSSYSGQITQYYPSTPPSCGSSGCANFTVPVGTYNWTASSTWSNWSGQVIVSKNGCQLVLLQ